MNARLNAGFGRRDAVLIESVADQLKPYLERPRFLAVLFGGLAAIAVVLAMVGLYAVASFEGAQRRFEMGIRIALGAGAHDIRRRIFRVTVWPAFLGAAGGLFAIAASGRVIASRVAEVSARDPWSYTGAAVVMIATAVLAAWLPARRASHIEPATVLRAP
jgi:putative ABC transport system permease protein